MKKLLFSCLLPSVLMVAAQQSSAQCNATLTSSGNCYPITLTVNANYSMDSISWKKNNTVVQTYVAQLGSGFIVAGGNGQGNAANQLNQPMGMHVDMQGNIYVADGPNHRIQKWAPGATTGVTVAGGNGQGNAANQLNFPVGVFVDANGDIFVSDCFNNRVQKWATGATTGVTVAGGNGMGSAGDQLNFAGGLFLKNGDIYIVDAGNSRVQKWASGATSGTTVAGGNGFGTALDQLATPQMNGNVYVDQSDNVYITEYSAHRVTKWALGATAGVVVAGGNGQGSAANQLNRPTGLAPDGLGGFYVTEYNNHRVQYWPLGSTLGTTIVGGNGAGPALNQTAQPTGFAKFQDTFYVCEYGNSRVTKFYSDSSVITNTFTVTGPGHYVGIVTNSGSCIDSVEFDITVPNPILISSISERDLCEGSALTLYVSSHDSFSYQWLKDGVPANSTVDSIVVTTGGSYAVVTNISGSCEDTTSAINVTVRDLPEPLITSNNNVLSTGTFASYQWMKNGVAIPGANSPDHTATEDGAYTVTVTNEYNCSGTSEVYNYSSVSLKEIDKLNGIGLYPNPASKELFLEAEQEIGQVEYRIVNILGQTLENGRTGKVNTGSKVGINISKLDPGIYYLILGNGKNGTGFKFTKM